MHHDDLMIACTWSSFNPSGGLGTLHPATVQSVGRLGAASLAPTSTNTPRINWRAEDIATTLVLLTKQSFFHVTLANWAFRFYKQIPPIEEQNDPSGTN